MALDEGGWGYGFAEFVIEFCVSAEFCADASAPMCPCLSGVSKGEYQIGCYMLIPLFLSDALTLREFGMGVR